MIPYASSALAAQPAKKRSPMKRTSKKPADMRSEYVLDYSKSKPNRFARARVMAKTIARDGATSKPRGPAAKGRPAEKMPPRRVQGRKAS